MLLCKADDLIEIHLLAEGDAARLEALKRNYTSHRGEWIYHGTAEAFIRGSRERFAANQGFWAGVWLGGELAGVIGFNNVSRWNRTAEIDYMLGVDYRGNGIMTRAVRALVTYGFTQLDLNRIEICPDAENQASCAIPERLGFVKEGTLRQKLFYGRDFGDQTIYAMLSQDWAP